jgi:hypothetical protein
MDWWQSIMPVESDEDVTISYQNKQTVVHPHHTTHNKDEVLLVIDRLTRIYFLENCLVIRLN